MSTATATALRPEKTGSWSSVFPNDQVTEQQSALFVKKLLAVSISNIAYLRAIFPEHAFGDRCLEDLHLKILRDDSSCPGACQIIKWVKGCFDALDKKYLRMLVIGIYVDPDDPMTTIEAYTFKFSYANQGGIDIYRNEQKIAGAYNESETKKATIRLLRTIVVLTQTLQSLPDDVMMTMKLYYYDDVTPPDYEPPGFKAADPDHFHFEEEPLNIKIGDVSTPFHTIKLRIKTDAKQFSVEEEAQNEPPETKMNKVTDDCLDVDSMEVDEQMLTSGKKTDKVNEKAENNHKKDSSPIKGMLPLISPSKPESGCESKAEANNSRGSVSATQEQFKVQCPCGHNEDDGLMIMCAICKLWQHGICFKILQENAAPDEHICDVCAKPSEKKFSTDPSLFNMSTSEVQDICLWRRALMAATESSRILAPQLSRRLGVEMTVAQGLLNRLEKENYVKPQGKSKRLGKVVDKEKIQTEGIAKYFCIGKDQESRLKEQVDILVKKTEDVSISQRTLRSRKEEGYSGMHKADTEDKDTDIRRQKRKRAVSKVNENEFELSLSQDNVKPSGQKKKASIVNNAIMV